MTPARYRELRDRGELTALSFVALEPYYALSPSTLCYACGAPLTRHAPDDGACPGDDDDEPPF